MRKKTPLKIKRKDGKVNVLPISIILAALFNLIFLVRAPFGISSLLFLVSNTYPDQLLTVDLFEIHLYKELTKLSPKPFALQNEIASFPTLSSYHLITYPLSLR